MVSVRERYCVQLPVRDQMGLANLLRVSQYIHRGLVTRSYESTALVAFAMRLCTAHACSLVRVLGYIWLYASMDYIVLYR